MIIAVEAANLSRIWLTSETHFTMRSLREHMEKHPHLGWMVQESGDYIIGGYWKDRPAIGLVMESSTSSQRAELAERLLQSYRETGSELAVLAEREVTHALPLYQDMGFAALEEVICYERPDLPPAPAARRLSVRRLLEDALAALVTLEQATFPWLWWETATTFRQTNQRPETYVMVAYLDSELVGYLILAVRGTWGHLNRVGVSSARQGQGFGRELMAFAIEEMARRGARTLGLNTQNNNARSQRLYEGCGFVRTGETFKIYGKWLDSHGAQFGDPQRRQRIRLSDETAG